MEMGGMFGEDDMMAQIMAASLGGMNGRVARVSGGEMGTLGDLIGRAIESSINHEHE